MGKRAASRRRLVRPGTIWFAGACVLTSLGLVLSGAVGAGVGVSGAVGLHPEHTAVRGHHAVLGAARQARPRYWWEGDVWLAAQPSTPAPPAPAPVPPPAPAPAPTTTTTTTAPPPPPPAPAPPAPASAPAPAPAPASSALPAQGTATAYGCAAALAYLSAYAAPGFNFDCPGNALGHQAMTCINEAGVCANEKLIAIADPCAAAYMNEASNSWVLTGASDAPIDPYGACS